MKRLTGAAIGAWLLMMGGSFGWNALDEQHDRDDLAFQTARAFFQQVVLTRAWNNGHGGVYVPVTEVTQPNPYLEDAFRDVVTSEGIRLTKINPAFMTRQIAEIAQQQEGVQFRITSLKPIRPANEPTEWERMWLESFGPDVNEQGLFVHKGEGDDFRYMAPLYTTAACLTCHAKDGYQEGDIRGGISVTLPNFAPLDYGPLAVGYGAAAFSGVALILITSVVISGMQRHLQQTNTSLRLEMEKRKEAVTKSMQYGRILEDSWNEFYLFDSETLKFIDVNRGARENLGYSREELLEMTPLDIKPDLTEDAFAELIQPLKSGQRKMIRFSTHHRRKDGSQYPMEAHVQMTADSPPQFFAFIQDVTERRRAEEERRLLEAQFQHSQKMESLGVLAGGIAHDFNNILMAVLGNTEMALEDLPDDSPVRVFLNEVETGAQRAADLTKQMLAYSGRGDFVRKSIHLTEVIEEMSKLLRSSITKNADLRFQLESSLPAIEADVTQMQQIVMNLVTNASEAIEARGHEGGKMGWIAVTTGVRAFETRDLSTRVSPTPLREGRYVFLEVADSGIGMDEATRHRIFEPFFTTKFTGRGLGMAATLGVVRGHEGAILVDSQLGKGTRFTVLFPAHEPPLLSEAPASAPTESRSVASGGRILIVDDEPQVLALAKGMVERMGYEVLTARDGLECLDVFREQSDSILCVILDLTMPRMDGISTRQVLQTIKEDVVVLIASGFTEQSIQQRFGGKQPAGFIQKPYTKNELQTKIQELLGGTPILSR